MTKFIILVLLTIPLAAFFCWRIYKEKRQPVLAIISFVVCVIMVFALINTAYDSSRTQAEYDKQQEELAAKKECADYGHRYVEKTISDATCTMPGEAKYTCSRCSDTYTKPIIAAHDYVKSIVLEATCTQPGEVQYTCFKCSNTYTEQITGHAWKKATYSEPKTCKVCGVTEGKPLGYSSLTSGLYQTSSDYQTIVMSWDELKGYGIISSAGTVMHGKESNLAGDLVLPQDTKRIKSCAFQSCNRLNSVVLRGGVVFIDYKAFFDCRGLKNIVLPETLTTIDQLAFGFCTSLESIEIPASVNFIGRQAFYGCKNLNTIKFKGTIEQWNAITFEKPNWNFDVPAIEVICSDGTVALT